MMVNSWVSHDPAKSAHKINHHKLDNNNSSCNPWNVCTRHHAKSFTWVVSLSRRITTAQRCYITLHFSNSEANALSTLNHADIELDFWANGFVG